MSALEDLSAARELLTRANSELSDPHLIKYVDGVITTLETVIVVNAMLDGWNPGYSIAAERLAADPNLRTRFLEAAAVEVG